MPYIALVGVNVMCQKAAQNLIISSGNADATHIVSAQLLTEEAFGAQVQCVYRAERNALVRVR